MPTLLRNRKAYHEYEIKEDYEAGIKLLGFEVKSLKEGRGSLFGTYIKEKKGELWLVNLNLPPYSKSGVGSEYDNIRDRKLLLNKSEIKSISGKISRDGYTVIPTKIYTKRGIIKVEIGLAKGKKKTDKKADLIRKVREREAEREIKTRF